MSNAIYSKTMENLRNIIHLRLVSNKKDYSKWTSKTIIILITFCDKICS